MSHSPNETAADRVARLEAENDQLRQLLQAAVLHLDAYAEKHPDFAVAMTVEDLIGRITQFGGRKPVPANTKPDDKTNR